MRCGVPSALYSTVTWLLASGRTNLQLAVFAQLGVVLHQAMGQVDRQRHQRAAFRCRRSRTSCPGRRRRRCRRPWRCRATARAGGTSTWQVSAAKPMRRIDVADVADGVADDAVDDVRGVRSALVVISPATMARSVVTSVSQATRLVGSAARQWSRMASLIWSATLSGWPIETDSLVNRYRFSLMAQVLWKRGKRRPPRPLGGLYDKVPKRGNYNWPLAASQ